MTLDASVLGLTSYEYIDLFFDNGQEYDSEVYTTLLACERI